MPTVFNSTYLYDDSATTTQSLDSMIDNYIDNNADKIKDILMSNELKKKRCKASKTFRDHYAKRDLLRLKH